MITTNYYLSVQSLAEWVTTITLKFHDIPLKDRGEVIANILAITDKEEIRKMEKASLIVYGNKLGVTSFEDACIKLNISNIIPDFKLIGIINDKYYIASYKLGIIVEAINDGWEPNWDDNNEKKWYPFFNMNSRLSFFDTHYNYDTGSSMVGSRLCLKSKELADYMGKMFIDLYEDYMK